MGRRLFAATVLGMVLVSFVGSMATALTKKQACDLVTEGDVEAAFGAAPSTTTEAGEKGKYTTCTWIVPVEGGTATAFVGIDKPSKPAKQDFKQNSRSPDAEKVSGIKKGFILGEGNALTVTFIQHGNFVNVQYLGSSPEDAEAHTDALIELAIGLYDSL